MMLKLFVLAIWCLILNSFVFPLLLYGPDLVPESLGKLFAYQIFLAIISGVYVGSIISWIFEE